MGAPEPGKNWLEDFVPYLLYRITNRLNLRLRRKLRAQKINIARWRVLAVLEARGCLNIGQIVNLTVMEQPTVSRVVADLEREGLVKRRPQASDSRIVEVSLTKRGEAAFAAIYPTANLHQERALAGFSKAEIAKLKSFLNRIHANISRQGD